MARRNRIGRRVNNAASLWERLNLGNPDETAWMPDGLCAQTDPEAFYPEVGGASVRVAKAVCARCPVLEMCRAYALEHGETHGVWGGLSAPERKALRDAHDAERWAA